MTAKDNETQTTATEGTAATTAETTDAKEKTPKKSSKTAETSSKNNVYVVGCKLPNGLVINGANKSVKLNGTNSSILINGYGTTHNVPAEIWDEFAKNFADSPLIRNGVVFAVSDKASAEDAAKEREKVKTGLEQADTSKTTTKPDKE